MDNLSQTRHDLAVKIMQTLRESGVEANLDDSGRDAIVHGRIEIEGKVLRVIAQLTDREPQTTVSGGVPDAIAKQRLLSAVIRPTLEPRSAANVPGDNAVGPRNS